MATSSRPSAKGGGTSPRRHPTRSGQRAPVTKKPAKVKVPTRKAQRRAARAAAAPAPGAAPPPPGPAPAAPAAAPPAATYSRAPTAAGVELIYTDDGFWAAPPRDHVSLAIQYARDVHEKRIAASKYVRSAAKRFLRDLEREANEQTWPYVFDVDQAGRACRFIEQTPHIKGPKAKNRELIVLEGWQCFIVCNIFGWVHRDTGKRRFRRVYIEVPRGNAKSTLLGAIGLYLLSADGEEGPEVYSAATTKDQAKFVWGTAWKMLRKRSALRTRLGIGQSLHSIFKDRNNGVFLPLSRDYGNLDGANTHGGLIDELHAHKNRELYDVIDTSTGKRDNSLICIITTAGTDTAGICYEKRTYVAKMLEGHYEDDGWFAVIYTIDEDEGDDWKTIEAAIKANPNWGVSVFPDDYNLKLREAMRSANAQNGFKTKHLNVWANAAVAWMNMVAWDKCVDPTLKIEDFEGQDCVEALDLASKVDLAARVRLFERWLPHRKGERDVNGEVKLERHVYAFLTSYLPEARLDGTAGGGEEEGDSKKRKKPLAANAQYRGWAKDEWIITTPGDVLDHDKIEMDVVEDKGLFFLRQVGYDPYQATQMAAHLTDEGIPMLEFGATVKNFSEPMKEWEALVMDGRFHTNADPCYRWQVSNVVCHRDAKDNIYPRKEQLMNKIDGPVATIMGIGVLLQNNEPSSPYQGESAGFKQL